MWEAESERHHPGKATLLINESARRWVGLGGWNEGKAKFTRRGCEWMRRREEEGDGRVYRGDRERVSECVRKYIHTDR